ncbi:MAG: GspE/PulE family protein [Patescibacteria group bacterium]|nr:GspE/PulE family protein [Patescibacteria group bacterium]
MIHVPTDKIKEALVDQGLIDADTFNAAVQEALRMNQDVGDVLVAKRYITYDFLYNFLASYYGVERALLNIRGIDQQVLLSIDEKFAQERKVIAFAKDDEGTVSVAMEDPTDLPTIEFLEKKLSTRIVPFLASPQDLSLGFSLYSHELTEDFKQIIEKRISLSLQQKFDKEEDAAKQIPIVEIVDNLISHATYLNASDIHIEAMQDDVMVRFRIDGILHEVITMPKQVHAAIVARIKLLSALKVDEHQKPQDGRFRFSFGQGVVDVRVSVIPTLYGEKVVMRLLASSQRPLSLNELGLSEAMEQVVQDNIKKTYGIVLVTGPTGSGKTTTLYSILNILNRPEVNIVTIEDPIEYNIKYINQTQINPLAGITFASGLRSILRQDPNIIMVGEIRDEETAEISVQAALTGHIVLSSIHTNDAPSTVARLLDMHVQPFLIAAVLNMAIAQRLVRKICIDCIESYSITPEEHAALAQQLAELKLPESLIPKTLYRGKGCKACNGIGYRGRMGIFEIFEVTDEARKIIASPDFSLAKLIELNKRRNTQTMFEDGLQKVALGLTTLEEVLRVVRE